MPDSSYRPAPVVGIGLNKTGTKTLGHYLKRWGYRHRSYDSANTTASPSFELYRAGQIDELLDLLDDFESAEDWPWPLLYKQIDERFPTARFVLTTRRDADVWYRSLCNMAVRIGPFPLYEKLVYGFGMPQGRKREHQERYERHNAEVQAHFADRPGKLLVLSWDGGDDATKLARFLGMPAADTSPLHVNPSPRNVYDGESLLRAHMHRLHYRFLGGPESLGQRLRGAVARRIGRA